MTVVAAATDKSAASGRVLWLDGLRGLAIIWIFLVHVSEDIFGAPFFMNPSDAWPPLADRIAQLLPIEGLGRWAIPANLLRWVGWLGDQGVQIFLIVSGYLLVAGGPRAIESQPLRKQWFQRLRRFLPMWWVALATFTVVAFVLGREEPHPFNLSYLLSVVGLRLRPEDLYYGAGSWWYINVLVQLALLAPFLIRAARRTDGVRLLSYLLVGSLAIRGIGLLLLEGDPYLHVWARGAILVTRLPEILAGMLIALWLQRRPVEAERLLADRRVIAGGAAIWLIGTLLGFSLLGNALMPLLTAVGLLVVLRPLFLRSVPRSIGWLGVHSLSIFIVHHPLVDALTARQESSGWLIAVMVIVAAAASLGAAILLEKTTEKVVGWFTNVVRRWRPLRTAAFAAVAVLALQGVVLASEVATRSARPQEFSGWGERPALQTHPDFGWRYKPDSSISLRWKSYDYAITTNEEGFPGPLPDPGTPDAGTLRVLVTGDAFTSGEGLAPGEVWPSRLAQLTETEVLNFAVTGFGPSQEEAVISHYLPLYEPDVVVVEMFVNDFFDVMVTNEDFRSRIGFQRADPNSWTAYLSGQNLRAWIKNEVWGSFTGVRDRIGWNLGNFDSLVKGAISAEMVSGVTAHLEEIREATEATGARLVVVMVPASAQLCGPRDLRYWPDQANLTNRRFDVDQPQRLAEEAAQAAGVTEFYDLRPALEEGCLYQPSNMHLTAAGQERMAQEIANILATG